MLSSKKLAAVLVYTMLAMTVLYIPFELFGPLQFRSLQIKEDYDPQMFLGLSSGQVGFVFLLAGVALILYLLFRVIRRKNQGGILQRKHRWPLTFSSLIALLTAILPLILVYFVFTPINWSSNGWFFVADLVAQGRFWWGMLMLFCSQIYQRQYTVEYEPHKLVAD
jgi:nitrogen fixation/metabolism regulation signal transduction histidine kinase